MSHCCTMQYIFLTQGRQLSPLFLKHGFQTFFMSVTFTHTFANSVLQLKIRSKQRSFHPLIGFAPQQYMYTNVDSANLFTVVPRSDETRLQIPNGAMETVLQNKMTHFVTRYTVRVIRDNLIVHPLLHCVTTAGFGTDL